MRRSRDPPLSGPLRSKAGGSKRTPARYGEARGPDDELARALRHHRAARYEEAVPLYRDVIVRDPMSIDAWLNLGGALVRLGRAAEARAALRRGAALAGGDPRAQRDAAAGLAAIGALEEARVVFERAVCLDEAAVGARLGLARLCLELGERDAAISHAERATLSAPSDASSWLELHRARFDDRALGPAIEASGRALELRPDYAVARLFHGAALAWDGDASGARAALAGGVLDAGLVDAVGFCQAHRSTARVFSSTRQTLLAACAAATLGGPVVELGVRHGVSTRLLARAAGGHVHAFDSFEGLPQAWHDKARGVFSTAGEVPEEQPNVTFHKGLFEDTLPPFVASLSACPRLVHVDSDLYESAATALRVLGPILTPGAILLFDEYLGNAHWRDDEHKAFEEAAARLSWRHELLALSWITGQACFRLTPGAQSEPREPEHH